MTTIDDDNREEDEEEGGGDGFRREAEISIERALLEQVGERDRHEGRRGGGAR